MARTSTQANEIITTMWATAVLGGMVGAIGVAFGIHQDNPPALIGGWLFGAVSGVVALVACIATGVKIGVQAARD